MARDNDLYADSCHRAATTHTVGSTASAVGVDGLMSAIATTMQAGLWTLVETGTQTGHPFYKLVSQRPPWWDDTVLTPPPGYNPRIKVHIFASANGSFQFRAMTADDAILQSTANNRCLVAISTGVIYRIIACPFQVVGIPNISDINVRTFLASTPNTPRWIQEKMELENILFASTVSFRTSLGAGGFPFFSVITNKDGTFTNDSFTAPVYGGSLVIPYTSRDTHQNGKVKVINAAADPTFQTPSLWHPLGSPPMVIWGDVSLGSTIVQDVNMIQCWLWDSIVQSETYTLGSTFTMPDASVWEAYTAPANNNQTLFFRSA